MLKRDIPFFAKQLNKMFPDAKTELYYNNEFQLLIAILMSAQATDKQVNIINRNFFEFLKIPKDGIDLGVEEITEFINSVSFFNNKSKNIYKTCNILVEKYQSQIPKTIEQLTELPGVGIKTAKVFLAVIEDAPYIGVDTHVHRVLNRLGLVNTKSPLETDKKISKNFTKENHGQLHNTLVLFGRYHCMARKPKCKTCEFSKMCKYYKKEFKKNLLK
ncbi:MAG: endonuclease III [Candidatus Gracilibacteria bacterium]|nr:endonuclease III [Candidatus Gracilibacteria bacterium]MDQ7022404.1 endonuclease III [Candidatus Gracilibacteria bacterium]